MEENPINLNNVLVNGFTNWRDSVQQATLDKTIKFKSSPTTGAESVASQQEVTVGGNNTTGFAALSNDLIQYVNLNLVRKIVAQNLVELLIICVIITYLIYYSSQISKRPKLIGNTRSKFVEFIGKTLNDTLSRRFNPLIYFWGTNPQTALFGYLQGQTSIDEMPRTSFKRQYIYVSDAQYLTSNIDLSQYYEKRNEKENSPFQLQRNGSTQHTTSLLNQNIRLAFDDMLARKQGNLMAGNNKDNGKSECVTIFVADGRAAVTKAAVIVGEQASKLAELRVTTANDQDLSSGSSSDSGMFVVHSSSSSSSASSSTSSLSEVLIGDSDRCSCKARYDDSDCNSEQAPYGWLSGKQEHETMAASSEQVAMQPNDPKAAIDCKRGHSNSDLVSNSEQLEFGQCALDWHKGSHKNYHSNKLVALISAGMTTGSDKKYVTDTVKNLEQLGYEVCVFIRRGVGGLKLSSAKFFSPAKWRDFEAAVLSVRQQRPGAHLVSVGFSFGSIELCRYLVMSGKRSLVDAALLISCPFDPEAGGRNGRKRALNRRIDAYLAKNLGKQLHSALFISSQQQLQPQQQQQQQQQLPPIVSNLSGSVVDLSMLPKIKSLVDFEDNYNRVIQNYPNSEAYAADSRLHEHLDRIKTPTLCLSSEDDFMAPLKLLPIDQIRANKNLAMVLTKRGGHMAFIDGIFWPKKPYFAQRIISNYLGAVKVSLLSDQQQP